MTPPRRDQALDRKTDQVQSSAEASAVDFGRETCEAQTPADLGLDLGNAAAFGWDTVRLPGRSPDPTAGEHELEVGTRVGRYVVLERVGSGGMGIVYAAYDPHLDRKVALKLVRHRRDRQHAGERLLREAQAIAKLAHPNIVTVFDADWYGDDVFLAMEFVAGRDLRSWKREGVRPWPDVLSTYVMAGRGLAAAHRAGFVHRDFKPENVLLGEDGRARVLDFGIAVALSRTDTGEALRSGHFESDEGGMFSPVSFPGRARASSDGSDRLESSDVMAGTPAYMAPELRKGARADHRSDQYSFCVALWETLTGVHPRRARLPAGASSTTAKRTLDKSNENLPRIPMWLRRAVERGMAEEPEERWASMDALLRRLDRRPTSHRVFIGGVLAGSLVLGTTFAFFAGAADPCPEPTQKVEDVWGQDRKGAIRAAFEREGGEVAARAFDGASEHLDGYLERWSRAHVEACRASRVRGEQSDALFDARVACLEDRRRAVDALAEVWSMPDAKIVDTVSRAAGSLPPLEECEDADTLLAVLPPPDDPAIAERVDTLSGELARATALEHVGKFAEGRALAEELVERVDATGYDPLRAEMHFRVGSLRFELGDFDAAAPHFSEAFWAGDASRHDKVAVLAATSMMAVEGYFRQNADAAEVWSRNAEAVTRRQGAQTRELARLWHYRGIVSWREGRSDDALREYERALELRVELLGEQHPEVADTLYNIALIREERGELEQAHEHYRRSLEIGKENLGPEHPALGWSYLGLGSLESKLERVEEGIAHCRRGVQILERSLAEDHERVVEGKALFARVLSRAGRMREAFELLDAVSRFDAAVAHRPDSRASLWLERGRAARALGELEVAIESLERALAIEIDSRESRARIGYELGVTLLQSGRVEEATQRLADALERLGEDDDASALRGKLKLAMAKARWSLGDRDDALISATEALGLLEDPSEAEEASDWIEEHARRDEVP